MFAVQPHIRMRKGIRFGVPFATLSKPVHATKSLPQLFSGTNSFSLVTAPLKKVFPKKNWFPFSSRVTEELSY